MTLFKSLNVFIIRYFLHSGERPKLWVTSKTHVREIDMSTHYGRPKLESLEYAVAMDFHIRKNYVAWSDMYPPSRIFM